jgi:hypothetical protein
MGWKNAKKDDLPENKQEVHISVEGITYVATYDSSEKRFIVRSIDKNFGINDDAIYWRKIVVVK